MKRSKEGTPGSFIGMPLFDVHLLEVGALQRSKERAPGVVYLIVTANLEPSATLFVTSLNFD